MRCCYKCEIDSDIHEHHVIPKHLREHFELYNTDKEGRILLCGKCHKIIHCLISDWLVEIILSKIAVNDADHLKEYIKLRTQLWLPVRNRE